MMDTKFRCSLIFHGRIISIFTIIFLLSPVKVGIITMKFVIFVPIILSIYASFFFLLQIVTTFTLIETVLDFSVLNEYNNGNCKS